MRFVIHIIKFIIFIFLIISSLELLSSEWVWNQKKGPEVYSKLSQDNVAEVYYSPDDDKKDDSKVSFLLNADDQIELRSEPHKVDKRLNKYTDKPEIVYYSLVRVTHNEGHGLTSVNTGWIRTSYLSATPWSPTRKPVKPTPPPCNPSEQKVEAKNKLNIQAALNSTQTIVDDKVDNIINEIGPWVGKCVASPPNNKITKAMIEEWQKEKPLKLVYDRMVLPSISQQKTPIFKSKKEDGNIITNADLMDIDVIARTIYGEMAKCHGKGIHNFAAVAKVGLNRADLIKFDPTQSHQYLRDLPHSSQKSTLAKVLTADNQFQNWSATLTWYDASQKKMVTEYNVNSLNQTLCPPSQPNKPYWVSEKGPSKNEQAIWKDAMRIATELVATPTSFRTKSKNIYEFIYTSNVVYGNGKLAHVFPSYDNHQLNDDDCVQMWDDGVDTKLLAKYNHQNYFPTATRTLNNDEGSRIQLASAAISNSNVKQTGKVDSVASVGGVATVSNKIRNSSSLGNTISPIQEMSLADQQKLLDWISIHGDR